MIPKIIHQIWIGPKKRPDIWMDTVKQFCSEFEYEYKLWDNDNVPTDLINQTFYNNDPTYFGKADILRYELLYRYGGCFVDSDSVIMKGDKFHELLMKFNTDAGLGFEIDGQLLCQGVCMSIPNSLFMQKCIEEIPRRDFSQLPWKVTGPMLVTELAIKHQHEIPLTMYKSTVFYPRRWHGIQDIDLHTKVEIPPESVMFQYGYSTNNLESKI